MSQLGRKSRIEKRSPSPQQSVETVVSGNGANGEIPKVAPKPTADELEVPKQELSKEMLLAECKSARTSPTRLSRLIGRIYSLDHENCKRLLEEIREAPFQQKRTGFVYTVRR